MKSTISFVLDGSLITLDFADSGSFRPTTTVLNYLRSLPNHQGTKRGCDEGDCGACTVVVGTPENDTIHYRAIDSCLLFLPMLHGKHIITVENLKSPAGELHPVQRALVEKHGSQCGFCTPGIVMSLFALYKNAVEGKHGASRQQIESALTGNLCRCTGYRTIIEAAESLGPDAPPDHFIDEVGHTLKLLKSIPHQSVQIRTGEQRYFLPSNIRDALHFIHQHKHTQVICGATDVALRVTKQHELISDILDLSHIAALQKVKEFKEYVEIGGGVVLQDVLPTAQAHFPALQEMLSVFGSEQIRNLATLGGNLGTASPISDTLPVLMAYRARVALESIGGTREVPMEKFILGYRKTARKPHEIITAIIIPKCADGTIVRSYKVAKRRDFDISTVSGGFRLERDYGNTITAITLAYGGMADRTKCASGAEHFLTGKQWNRESVEGAMKILDKDFSPITDVRAGAEMRRIVAKNLLLKFWVETNGNGHGK